MQQARDLEIYKQILRNEETNFKRETEVFINNWRLLEGTGGF